MKKFTILLLITIFGLVNYLFSAPGDKTIVNTIDFQERRIGWYDFPTTEKKYEKILLHYKLRCPPGKPCGEWDYLSYVFMNQWFAPSFRADKKVVDSLRYMKDTSWNYAQTVVNGEKVITKTPKTPIKIEFYNDKTNLTKLTDSITVWPTYYSQYKFDANGKATDSVFVQPDSTLKLSKTRVFFNDDVTFSERWELFRYITPYGNGITLGDGVTWTLDVTDFAPLLKGKVHLDSPYGGWGDPYDNNAYEDLELTFEFVEGTPPRDVINVKRLWNYYGITYDKYFENYIAPYNYTFSSNEKTAMMRVTQTGHGFGGTADNCAEFCRKLGMAKVDGVKQYEQYVWRECGTNPIYPQGGTWIFDRSNWCPGAEVAPFDFELTQYLKQGTAQTIDYDMEYYDLKWSGGSNTKPNWVLTGFLFTYGDYNFTNDARITKIISPNSDRLYGRLNPICGNPEIEIQNVGKNAITKVKVKYGNDPSKLVTSEITLDKPLAFMEKDEIELPNNGFYDETKPNVFYVELIEANGKPDENSFNNKMNVNFNSTIPEFFNKFTIELFTPNSDTLGISSPIQYYLEDANGKVLYSRATTQNSKQYNDEVNLADGCYRFTILNTQGYGLGFWAYQPSLRNGSLRFSVNGSPFKQFPTDWGSFYSMEFRVAAQPAMSLNIQGDTLNFGNVLLGEKATKVLEITPANEKGLKIDNLAVILGSSKKFEIVKTVPEGVKGVYDLKYGEKLEVTLSFEPQSDGIKTTALRINSNDFLNWQKNIILAGRGRDPLGVENNTISTTEISLKADYSISSNNIQLKMNVSELGFSGAVSLFDILGNKVASIPDFQVNNYEYETTLDAVNLNSGVYYLSFVYHGSKVNSPVLIAR
jgi:hypothetical protein